MDEKTSSLWPPVEDKDIFDAIERERQRQNHGIELIASENFVSPPVLQAQGSILTNKYAEGYPHRRYYGGCVHVDCVEDLAMARARQLFSCDYANVQPHSGSQANQTVFLACLNPGDCILSLSLQEGGHLTHGSNVNMSGKWFRSVFYTLDPQTHRICWDSLRRMAHTHKPKLIIAGASAYARTIDFAMFRAVADEVGALLLADVAHIAGLMVAGVHPHAFPHAHIVTSTTHKTLRGPRGGIILTNDAALSKKINAALFPGLQGGPLMHVIAAKAVCFLEALHPSFKTYAGAIVANAQAMAQSLKAGGLSLVSGGTDNHLILIDLLSTSLSGAEAEKLLEEVGITCNKNAIPGDPRPPQATSGIRVGTPAITTRGFSQKDCENIGAWIAALLSSPESGALKQDIAGKVAALCQQHPLPYGPLPSLGGA